MTLPTHRRWCTCCHQSFHHVEGKCLAKVIGAPDDECDCTGYEPQPIGPPVTSPHGLTYADRKVGFALTDGAALHFFDTMEKVAAIVGDRPKAEVLRVLLDEGLARLTPEDIARRLEE